MGKQVRFFMTSKDEEDFLKFVVECSDSIIDNKAFDLTVEEATSSTSILSLFIAPRNVSIAKDKNGFVDPVAAEVIQFSRCILLEGKYLKNGRIWIKLKYYDDTSKLVNKSKDLKDTYSIYEKWIKKNFRLSKCKDYYVANDAYRSYKEDRTILMDGPKQVIEFD